MARVQSQHLFEVLQSLVVLLQLLQALPSLVEYICRLAQLQRLREGVAGLLEESLIEELDAKRVQYDGQPLGHGFVRV